MILKERTKPVELQQYQYLRKRMTFADDETNYYENMEKGWEGELLFDIFFKELLTDCLIVNDLLLDSWNSTFQLDSTVLFEHKIYMFEVKNFEGDFFIQGDQWIRLPKKEIKNPMLQLKRSESLLRRLLQDLGVTIPIESYLIFINPNFHLYQAPINQSIIYPTQLSRFMHNLNNITSTITNKHTHIANQLISAHITDSPFKRCPQYEYEYVEKGITCSRCGSILSQRDNYNLVCNCGCKESVSSSLKRSINEFSILFPERKITTKEIYEWCGEIVSKRSIQHVLTSQYEVEGIAKARYYIKQ